MRADERTDLGWMRTTSASRAWLISSATCLQRKGRAEGQAASPERGDPLTSRSCAALGRVSGFLSRAVFRKSRNSTDLRGQVAAVSSEQGAGRENAPRHRLHSPGSPVFPRHAHQRTKDAFMS